jgi:hypothetical protein
VLASVSPDSFEGCLTNRLTLVSWLDRLVAALVEVRRELAAPDCSGEALAKMAGWAHAALEEWSHRRDDRQKELEALQGAGTRSAKDQFLGMFVPPALLKKSEQGDEKATRR